MLETTQVPGEDIGLNTPETEVVVLPRKQREARRLAKEHYSFECCVVCGLQLPGALTVAHLDHEAGNNEPDNLAWLCGTHHWMFDCGLYPVEAVKLMRTHWQQTKGKPSHAGRMKQAGPKAAETRRKSAIARKAWVTRRAKSGSPSSDSQQ